MPEEVAEKTFESEQRIDRLIGKIGEMEAAGRRSDAERARQMLAVITETRDALRLRLRVSQGVAATQTRKAANLPRYVFFPEE